MGVVVSVALVFGVVGWSRHLTQPRGVVRLASALVPRAVPAAAERRDSAIGTPRGPVPSGAGSVAPPGVIPLSPQDILDELRSDPTLAPAQVFAQRFQDRAVTWSGTVTAVSPPLDRLQHFEFTDGGVRVEAWCTGDALVAAGLLVTVRGQLTTARLKDGLVVDRCRIL